MAEQKTLPPGDDHVPPPPDADEDDLSPAELKRLIMEQRARAAARRTKLLLAVLLVLLAVPAALAFLVLSRGRSDVELIEDRAAETAKRVGESQNLHLTELSKEVGGVSLKYEGLDRQVDEIDRHATELKDVLRGNLNKVQQRIDAQTGQVTQRLSAQSVLLRSLQARLSDLPKNGVDAETAGLIAREEIREASSPESESPSAEDFRSGVRATVGYEFPAVATAEKFFADRPLNQPFVNYANLLSKIEALETRVRELEEQVKVLKPGADATTTAPARDALKTYAVKENSTAQIYDLGIKVEVGSKKGDTIKNLKVFKLDFMGNKVEWSEEKKNALMGSPAIFGFTIDSQYIYVLTPTHIMRRRFAKDFIGFTITKRPNPLYVPPKPKSAPDEPEDSQR